METNEIIIGESPLWIANHHIIKRSYSYFNRDAVHGNIETLQLVSTSYFGSIDVPPPL